MLIWGPGRGNIPVARAGLRGAIDVVAVHVAVAHPIRTAVTTARPPDDQPTKCSTSTTTFLLLSDDDVAERSFNNVKDNNSKDNKDNNNNNNIVQYRFTDPGVCDSSWNRLAVASIAPVTLFLQTYPPAAVRQPSYGMNQPHLLWSCKSFRTSVYHGSAFTMFRYTKTLAVGFCALFRAACLTSMPSQSIGD